MAWRAGRSVMTANISSPRAVRSTLVEAITAISTPEKA